jgi:hypothetical protein
LWKYDLPQGVAFVCFVSTFIFTSKMMTFMDLPHALRERVVAIILLRPDDVPNALALLADFSAVLDETLASTTVAIVGSDELMSPMIRQAVDDFQQCKSNPQLNFTAHSTGSTSSGLSNRYSCAVEHCVREYKTSSSLLIINAGTRLIDDDASATSLLAKLSEPAQKLDAGLVIAQLENNTRYYETYATNDNLAFAPPFAMGSSFLLWLATAKHLQLKRANCYTLITFLEDLGRISGHRIVYASLGNVAYPRILVTETMTPTIPASPSSHSRKSSATSATGLRSCSSTSALHVQPAKYVAVNTLHGLVWLSSTALLESRRTLNRTASFETIGVR